MLCQEGGGFPAGSLWLRPLLARSPRVVTGIRQPLCGLLLGHKKGPGMHWLFMRGQCVFSGFALLILGIESSA